MVAERLEIKGIVAGIIFLALVIFLLHSIFTEKYVEAMVLSIVTFAMYFAASGKLKKFKGLGIELEFLKEKSIVKQDEKIILPAVEGEDVVFEDKRGIDHLERKILPKMNDERYTTLAIKKGIRIDRYVIKDYLEKLLRFDFFEHIIFLNDDRKFSAHIDAKTFYWIFREDRGNNKHEQQANEIITLINQWNLIKIPGIVTDSIMIGANYFDALQLMKISDNKYLSIVDDVKQFKGILTKEEVLDEIVKASKLKITPTH